MADFRYLFLKAVADKFLAFLMLLILSPLLIFLSALSLVKIGPPLFFVQKRAGIDGTAFLIIKFRSMSCLLGDRGELLCDAYRLSQYGIWLRSTSLDELPSLVNIIRGQMSFVGPRALLIDYNELYSSEQARRLSVKPGLTGWAQINGRNALSWDEKFRLDVWYVNRQNFWLDLRILIITIWKVFSREGISAAGEATMAPFMGSATAPEAR